MRDGGVALSFRSSRRTGAGAWLRAEAGTGRASAGSIRLAGPTGKKTTVGRSRWSRPSVAGCSAVRLVSIESVSKAMRILVGVPDSRVPRGAPPSSLRPR